MNMWKLSGVALVCALQLIVSGAEKKLYDSGSQAKDWVMANPGRPEAALISEKIVSQPQHIPSSATRTLESTSPSPAGLAWRVPQKVSRNPESTKPTGFVSTSRGTKVPPRKLPLAKSSRSLSEANTSSSTHRETATVRGNQMTRKNGAIRRAVRSGKNQPSLLGIRLSTHISG